MPEPLTIEQKCDRLAQLNSEMKVILYAEDGARREYTAEEGEAFDAKLTEAHGLKNDIATHKANSHRLDTLDDLRRFADETPRPIPPRDQPGTNQGILDLAKGRYSLRNFTPRPGRPTHEAHEAAYKTGLTMIARCGQGAMQDWAMNKCKEAGLNVAQLTPYQSEDGNSSGGYLVFPEFEATLINLKEQYGVLQREAFKIPMNSDTLIIPRRAGGTTVYYPGEHGQITESAMAFDQVQLVAKKYAQMTRWSTELNEDSVIAMADLLAGEMSYQFAKAEDTNGFLGDGTSAYAGTIGLLFKLVNTVNGVSPTASLGGSVAGGLACLATHTTLQTTTLADWEMVVGKLPLYAEGRAKWYMSKSAFWAGPARLMDAAGGNIAIFLSSGAPMRFLGYDVVFSQVMPTASTAVGTTAASVLSVPAILGDMAVTSYLGTRRGVTVRTSDQRYIEYDQIAIQCTQRVAVNNVVGDSVAPTSVCGPMVGLHLAAT